MSRTTSCRRISLTLFLPLLVLGVAACGDEHVVALDDRVDLAFFTDIDQPLGGQPTTFTQRVTVTLSPTLSRADVDRITRVRLIHPLAGDWLLGLDDGGFVSGDGGWELVEERSAAAGVPTGIWNARMVVEEQGVHVAKEQLFTSAVGAPAITTLRLTPQGEVEARWGLPVTPHDWTASVVRRTPAGEGEVVEEVLGEVSGEGRGGGSVSAGFGVPPSAFAPPNELLFRLVMTNEASRRTVEGVLEPED